MVSENRPIRDRYNVVIIGGGPAGSTCATMIRKHNPDLSVCVLEKARFPRDHIGESQLPGCCAVLHEMGCWDKIEAAGFPIKIGASYTWGRNADQWDFDFYPIERYVDEPRPGRYEGQRTSTAFQVDRAIYDDILLRHAEEFGTEVFEEARVVGVNRDETDPDRIESLSVRLADGSEQQVRADHFVDASGTVGVIRRAMGVDGWVPEELKNIAVWDYWQNTEWAVRIGVGATRVQVRSLPYGWIWFIPLGPTRTSIGLVCPAKKYKEFGLSPAELYRKALSEQAEVQSLIRNATSEGKLESTKDWSNIADRLTGTNWFLAGEASGFADPILAAGMNLAHSAAKDLAFTILELYRGDHDGSWLRARYDERHRSNISQHIRFAQFWYASNGQFTDLKEHCQKIAKEAGLKLNPDKAWQWLSQGGFIAEDPGHAVLGSVDLTVGKAIAERLDGGKGRTSWKIEKYNLFTLDVEGAKRVEMGMPRDGRILKVQAYKRDGSTLPLIGPTEIVVRATRQTADWNSFTESVRRAAAEIGITGDTVNSLMINCLGALEGLLLEGWIKAKLDPKRPKLREAPTVDRLIRDASESAKVLAERELDHTAAELK